MISKFRAAQELVKNVNSGAASGEKEHVTFVDIQSVVTARKKFEDCGLKIKLLKVCRKYDVLPAEVEKTLGVEHIKVGSIIALNRVLKNIYFEQKRIAKIEHDGVAAKVFGELFWKHKRYIRLISGFRVWAVQKWKACLHNVNARRSRSTITEEPDSEVLIVGTPNIDEQSKRDLSKGPKYAPKYSPKPEELIADVKNIRDHIPEQDKEAFNSLGSKLIQQFGKPTLTISTEEANIKKTIKKLKINGDRVLEADKESRLVVIDGPEYETRSLEAINKNFKPISARINNLVKDRDRAIEIFGHMEKAELKGSWKSRIALSTLDKYLKVFFSVKTHKTEPFPFRAIVDSGGTWQYVLETFLLKGLDLFDVNDSFAVKNTTEAVEGISQFHNIPDMKAASFDASDMYFNMSHTIIMEIVKEQIVKFGVTEFVSKTGMEVFEFLELLEICLRTSVIKFDLNNELYIQKSGICIGSRIAPKIADLFTAKINKAIAGEFEVEISKGMIKFFKYVDDYLVLFHRDIELQLIKAAFDRNKLSLEFTVEELDEHLHIQFLDILVITKPKGVCWRNQQRKAKGILPFRSNHARAIKVGIVKGLMRSAVLNSCEHECQESMNMQRKRLSQAGYRLHFIIQQILALSGTITEEKREFDNDKAVVIIQYYHEWAHRIKKLAGQFEVRIIFKYCNKLGRLAPITNAQLVSSSCGKSGHLSATQCMVGTVYQVPMKCGKCYIGQSGVCINCRLYQHQQTLRPKSTVYSTLATHVRNCPGCVPIFKDTVILDRGGKQKNREILEAYHIDRGGTDVISESSISLRNDELEIIRNIRQ
jgi:hypothetical protein